MVIGFRYGFKPGKQQTFIEKILNALISIVTWSKYAHCELMSKVSYSSTMQDGVRKLEYFRIDGKWDYYYLPVDEDKIEEFYQITKNAKYDFLGTIFPFMRKNKRYYCSEWCGLAIEYSNGIKLDYSTPKSLHKSLIINKLIQCQ